MIDQRRIAPSSGAAHPHQSRQSQSRAAKFFVRGKSQADRQNWTAARYSFATALAANPDAITEAYATIGRAACEAAIEAIDLGLDPAVEYDRVAREMSGIIPLGGGA